jgi:hypothetical protein
MLSLRSLSEFVLALGVVLTVLGLPGAAAAGEAPPADRPASVEWNPTWPRFRPAEIAVTSGLVLQVAAVTFLYPAIALSAEKLGRVRPEARECAKDAGYAAHCENARERVGRPTAVKRQVSSGATACPRCFITVAAILAPNLTPENVGVTLAGIF